MEREADSLADRVNKSLKGDKSDIKDPRGLARWYADAAEKGLAADLGKDLKLAGEIDLDEMKVSFSIQGKF